MNGSVRRRGQLLVVAGALLGAVAGAALGLGVESTETPGAIGPSALDRRGVGAGGKPAEQPTLEPSGDRSRSQAGDRLSEQRPHPMDQADRRGDKARKHSRHDRRKPSDRGKATHGKGK